jgi:GNAT superfamily N-acetyltransferase
VTRTEVNRDDARMIDIIDWHAGPRAELRPLFELADDSSSQLDRYLELGRVRVARRGPAALGHLQLVPTTRSGEIELKNMAVVPERRGTGVGREPALGELLALVPRHVCPTINLFDSAILLDAGNPPRVIPVTARGRESSPAPDLPRERL